MYSVSISDCVEACSTVNEYADDSRRMCISGTFVPQWINRTLSITPIEKPSNCFSKYAAVGIREIAILKRWSECVWRGNVHRSEIIGGEALILEIECFRN